MIPTWFRMLCLFQMMTGHCPGWGNESGAGTPFRASGTKLSVPSGGAVYGGCGCVGSGFLDPVFRHGEQEIPPELMTGSLTRRRGIVILNFIIKNGLLVFAGIDVIGRLPGV